MAFGEDQAEMLITIYICPNSLWHIEGKKSWQKSCGDTILEQIVFLWQIFQNGGT